MRAHFFLALLTIHGLGASASGPAADKICKRSDITRYHKSCKCPTGKICDIDCSQSHSCHKASFTGTFRNIVCGAHSCMDMPHVVKVTGNAVCQEHGSCCRSQGFEVGGTLSCIAGSGYHTCDSLKKVVKAGTMLCRGNVCGNIPGVEAKKLVCDGSPCAFKGIAKATEVVCKNRGCTKDTRLLFKDLHCTGQGTCSGLSPTYDPSATAATVTCSDGADCRAIQQAKIDALPQNLKALKFAGDLPWPRGCQAGAKKTWWYCPHNKVGAKCAPQAARCSGDIKRSRAPSPPEHHLATNFAVGATMEIATVSTKKTYKYFALGKTRSLAESMRRVEDYGFGNQGLATKMTGGLRCVAGTLTSVDAAAPHHFDLPKGFHPNFDSKFLCPVVVDGALFSATATVFASGRVVIRGGNELPITAKVSLGHFMLVPREVKGATDLSLNTRWSVALGLTAYYTKLNMRGGAHVCVLSGSVTTTTKWEKSPAGREGGISIIAELDSDCTKGYREHGFWLAANVEVSDLQRWVSNDPGKAVNTDFLLTFVDGNKLALWSRTQPTGQKMSVSLDGVSLASGPSLPTTCRTGGGSTTKKRKRKSTNRASFVPNTGERALLREAHGSKVAAANVVRDHLISREDPVLKLIQKLENLPTQLGDTQGGCPIQDAVVVVKAAEKKLKAKTKILRKEQWAQKGKARSRRSSDSSNMKGCSLVQNKVNTTAGLPHESIIGMQHRIIMGTTLPQRTCVLRGVISFTVIDDSAVAQLDPNLRDPVTGNPLCFPLSVMTFFAGVVDSKSSPIMRSVAVQIDMNGLLKVVAGSISAMGATPGAKVLVRLDGISYHPFMPYNAVPNTCAPYCFTPPTHGANSAQSSGCIKSCTPAQYVHKSGTEVELNNCRCDMLKWLSCYTYEGNPNLQCSQYKQLLKMHLLVPKRAASKVECGKMCAEQLSSF